VTLYEGAGLAGGGDWGRVSVTKRHMGEGGGKVKGSCGISLVFIKEILPQEALKKLRF